MDVHASNHGVLLTMLMFVDILLPGLPGELSMARMINVVVQSGSWYSQRLSQGMRPAMMSTASGGAILGLLFLEDAGPKICGPMKLYGTLEG